MAVRMLPLSEKEIAIKIPEVLNALANPGRLEILRLLKDPESHFPPQNLLPLQSGVCANQIQAKIGLSQPTTSAHLASLLRVGLVKKKRVGQWVYFSRDEANIKTFMRLFAQELLKDGEGADL